MFTGYGLYLNILAIVYTLPCLTVFLLFIFQTKSYITDVYVITKNPVLGIYFDIYESFNYLETPLNSQSLKSIVQLSPRNYLLNCMSDP